MPCPLFERALAIREKTLGPEHPDTAESLINLGSLLHDKGEFAGARPLFERALAINEKALGPEHLHTALSLSSLANLLCECFMLCGNSMFLFPPIHTTRPEGSVSVFLITVSVVRAFPSLPSEVGSRSHSCADAKMNFLQL